MSKPYNFRESTRNSISVKENRLTLKPQPHHEFAQLFPVFKPDFTQNELDQFESLKKKGKYLFTSITLPYSMPYIHLNRTDICVSAISYPETKYKCVLAHDLLLNVPGYSSFVQKNFLKPPHGYTKVVNLLFSSLMVQIPDVKPVYFVFYVFFVTK